MEVVYIYKNHIAITSSSSLFQLVWQKIYKHNSFYFVSLQSLSKCNNHSATLWKRRNPFAYFLNVVIPLLYTHVSANIDRVVYIFDVRKDPLFLLLTKIPSLIISVINKVAM